MQRLIYISTVRDRLKPAELDGILLASRRNNAIVGVTGLLVAGGQRFLQALEGPGDAVQSVFQRIERDSRHFAIVTLSKKPIQDRTFPNWSMGFQRGAADADDHGALKNVVERLVAPIEDPMVRAYFTEFAALHAAA